MEKQDFEKLYKRLISDTDFEHLELIIKEPNIFMALGIVRHEFKHSNFLSWLLNPKGSHGMGSLFLKKFMKDILVDERSAEVSILELAELKTEEAIIRREWKNIDILIELSDVIIAIENKIYSTEHSNQLSRYRTTVEETFKNHRKIFVYLTPFGFVSSMDDCYINYSYEAIIDILCDIIRIYRRSLNDSVVLYLENYIQIIKEYIMENGNINEIARKIYLNHKDILDVIIENKPDYFNEFQVYLEEKVRKSNWVLCSKNKYYVRFLTSKLFDIIPIGYAIESGWSKKESFLFELSFYTKNYVRINCSIPPGDNDSKNIFADILNAIPGLKKNINSKWFTYYNENIKCNIEDLMNSSADEIFKFLDKIWPSVEKMVGLVETAILSNQKILMDLNNSRGKEKK